MIIQRQHQDIIYEVLNDDIVIVSLASGNYYNLREFPEVVWEALATPLPREMVLAAFPNAANHVNEVLDLLIAENIVQIVSEADELPVLDCYPELKPTFEKFSDVQNLLLIDPVHEIDETGWPAVAGSVSE